MKLLYKSSVSVCMFYQCDLKVLFSPFIKKYTSFEPEYNLDQGLKKTIEWFSIAENLKNYKSHLYNV